MAKTTALTPSTWLVHGAAVVTGTSALGLAASRLAAGAPIGVQLAAIALTWSLPVGWACWMATRTATQNLQAVESARPTLRVILGQRSGPTKADGSRAGSSSLYNAPAPNLAAKPGAKNASRSGGRPVNNCRCLHLERLVGGVAVAYAEDHLLVLSRAPQHGRVRLLCARTGVTWVGLEPWATSANRTEICRTAQPERVGGRRRRRAASKDQARISQGSRIARPRWPAIAPNRALPPRRIP